MQFKQPGLRCKVPTAKLTSELAPSPAREKAAIVVADKWLPGWNNRHEPPKPEAITWLKSLDDASLSHVIEHLQWGWSGADPKTFAEVVAGLKDRRIPASSFNSLSSALARNNPQEAIQWASQLGPESQTAATSHVFREWWRSQPDPAMSWFRELPENDARRDVLFSNLMHELVHSPHATAQLAKLSSAERAAAEKTLPTIGISEERRAVLLNALKNGPGTALAN